jgi:hypothetical protein
MKKKIIIILIPLMILSLNFFVINNNLLAENTKKGLTKEEKQEVMDWGTQAPPLGVAPSFPTFSEPDRERFGYALKETKKFIKKNINYAFNQIKNFFKPKKSTAAPKSKEPYPTPYPY